MENPRSIFQNALLAQAAYGDFEIDSGAVTYSKETLEEGLQVLKKGEFTAKQAEIFADTQGYALRSFTSDSATGFEAALFESRAEPGKFTLAIRGTSGLLDVVGADIFGVVAQGQAAAQSVSLYRYYKRLITPRGALVQYSQAEVEMLAAVTNRKYDGYSAAALRASSDFRSAVAGLAARLSDDAGLGRLDPNARIDVTGHSLGGHLAQVFGALFFPDRVDHIYTYNGAGLGGSAYKVARRFLNDRGVDLAARSTHIVAEEGLTLAAGIGYKYGPVQKLAIEPGVLLDNHSVTNTTDALALYDLLGQMSPELALDSFNKIVRSASNEAKNGYEATLDILRRMFLGPEIQPTQQSFRDDPVARDELYKNIDELKRSIPFMEFVGASGRPYSVASLVGALNPAGLAADEVDGMAYRYALKRLNPFAVLGVDYSQYNQHGELDLYDPATGLGAITPEWLQDRAQFLAWKNKTNFDDVADGISILRKDNGVESFLYTDKTLKNSQGQDYSIRVVGGNTLQQADPIRISFASDAGDDLQGGRFADRLYGGRGSDTLTGGDGSDYLEGGANSDTLIGGAGDDTLQGGKGDDVLQGGPGNDIYLIRAGDGRDTIIDHEGRNTVIYADANGKRSVFALPGFAVAGQSNTWTGYLAAGERVTFTRNSPLTATLPDGGQIVFDDYQDGDFGIQLKSVAQEIGTANLLILGDLEPKHDSFYLGPDGEKIWEADEDELGNVITDPATPAPDRQDWLFGSDGSDAIYGFGGNDRIYGGDGADYIQGGTGFDWIYGETGDDVLEGQDSASTDEGNDYDYLSGGPGDDSIFATTWSDLGDAVAQGNEAGLESRGSRLQGGPGDDVIVGSKGLDRIAGGAGCDVLIGGGGGDYILGDADFTSVWDVAYGPNPGTAADDCDAIYGGGGGDIIFAGIGDDYVDGGDGGDYIYGEGGADVIFGGAGDDYILAIVNAVAFDDGDDYIDGGDGNDYIVGSNGDNVLLGGDGDDIVGGAGGNDYVDGGSGNDKIQGNDAHGGPGDDLVAGTAGPDTLYGDDGDDVLAGWNFFWSDPYGPGYVPAVDSAGEDWLYGGAGNDTYLFALGAGNVHVVDDSGINRIILTSYEVSPAALDVPGMYAPIAADSVHVELEGGGFKLTYGDAGDSIDLGASVDWATTIVDLEHVTSQVHFDEDTDPGHLNPVASIETLSETVPWSGIVVSQYSVPDEGTLIAAEGFSNQLAGGEGNDTIVGASRDDVLIGGAGNDILDGADGSDRYVFNPGDGIDVISDSGTQGSDTLVFGPGIVPASLTLGVVGSLALSVGDSGDVVYVDGFDPDDAAAGVGIERFEFADGTALSTTQLVARGFDLYGSEASDTEFGTNLVDRFHDSAGDDVLIGGAGDDFYYFGVGSGHDLVVDVDSTANNVDTVVFGAGITPENIAVQSGAGMLGITISDADSRLDIQWQPEGGYAIERFQFADGSIWDGAMLAGRAMPAPQVEPDPDTVPNDGTASADSGSSDDGSASPGTGETTPPASAGAPNTDSTAPPADSTQANAGSSDDGSASPGTGETTPPASAGAPNTDSTVPPADTTYADAGPMEAPADKGTADSATTAPPGGDTAQTPSDLALPMGSPQTDVTAVPPATSGDIPQAANAGEPTVASGTSNPDPGTQTDAGPTVVAHGATPSAENESDAAEAAEATAPPGGGEAPPLIAEQSGAQTGTSADASITAGGTADPSGEPASKSSDGAPTQMSESVGTAAASLPAGSVQSETDTLVAELLGSDAIDSAASRARLNNAAKPVDVTGGQYLFEQSTSTLSRNSLFDALRPAQPSMQAWLDNWLGPRARAAAGSRENANESGADGLQPVQEQEIAPVNPSGDIPDAQSLDSLTSEQIAQSYQDIAAWLDVNPGIEQEDIEANGSPAERSLFNLGGVHSAGATGFASPAWFGHSSGMDPIGGPMLAPLHGLSEGYAPLTAA